MNAIFTQKSGVLAQTAAAKEQNEIETTGSLAMNNTPLFSVPVYNYDMFVPTNPFSLNIDFSSYSAEGSQNLADNSSFMQGFANAMSVISNFNGASFSGGTSACASVASASCGGGSCSVGGGFTSVG